ncbi:EPIDERMAL PATTERNING FACTOR-like protein 2 [Prunus yedoensis var. nudiflora]|uniref:Epidermal patterning factor-like protein n=1 Tax=Prunus yedoensis var. nudiflora TaxID=2094558 RepID=A0A314YY00_PRUYE|nr:EPIDERMAL PATTERNING FACTOR-like protein 2 [Prunus yedoensis var. nudiflora]
MAEGRAIHNRVGISQAGNEEKKVIVRGQIGSRPPRCERRCSSCGHCEAIQVPANPQVKSGNKNSSVASTIAYARGDENSSNYKPMSWKCKCGNSIFNP